MSQMTNADSSAVPAGARLDVELLEESFQLVAPRAQEFVGAFYAKLFELYPETRRFFARTDMALQQAKLVSALVFVIENLRKPESLIEPLRVLGQKHEAYQIKPAHYSMVGDALLKTFSVYLGAAWNPEVEMAWARAYGVITQAMLSGYLAPHAP